MGNYNTNYPEPVIATTFITDLCFLDTTYRHSPFMTTREVIYQTLLVYMNVASVDHVQNFCSGLCVPIFVWFLMMMSFSRISWQRTQQGQQFDTTQSLNTVP